METHGKMNFMVSYPTAFDEYSQCFWMLSLIPAGLLLLVFLRGVYLKKKRGPLDTVVWWSERIAMSTLLLGCLLATFKVVHLSTLMRMMKPEVHGFMFRMTLVDVASQFAWFCGVALAGVLVAMALKLMDKKSSNKQMLGTASPPEI